MKRTAQTERNKQLVNMSIINRKLEELGYTDDILSDRAKLMRVSRSLGLLEAWELKTLQLFQRECTERLDVLDKEIDAINDHPTLSESIKHEMMQLRLNEMNHIIAGTPL